MGVDKTATPNCYDMLMNGADAADCIRSTKYGDVLPANMNLSGCSVELVGSKQREYIMKTALTAVRDDYYEYLFKSMMDDETPATDWSEGYNEGAVAITDLGPEVAEGTAEKVAEVEAALKDGSLHVFDTSKFTALHTRSRTVLTLVP